jgi:hypothetical protein
MVVLAARLIEATELESPAFGTQWWGGPAT